MMRIMIPVDGVVGAGRSSGVAKGVVGTEGEELIEDDIRVEKFSDVLKNSSCCEEMMVVVTERVGITDDVVKLIVGDMVVVEND